VIYVFHAILFHARGLRPMTCVFLVVTLHMHGLPPMIFVLHIVTLPMHMIPPLESMLCIINLFPLFPLLYPFVCHVRISSIAQRVKNQTTI
jgi:hypothetical protein